MSVAAAGATAQGLKTMAHPVRLALLQALASGERSVGALEAQTGVGQPLLSQQLAILRTADLVLSRRRTKQVFYSLNHPAIAGILTPLARLTAAPPVAAPVPPPPASQIAAAFARVG